MPQSGDATLWPGNQRWIDARTDLALHECIAAITYVAARTADEFGDVLLRLLTTASRFRLNFSHTLGHAEKQHFINTRRRKMDRFGRRIACMGVVATLMFALAGCVVNPNQGGQVISPPPPERKAFKDPKTHGKWLDICAQRGACRTQVALNTYCKRKGYDRAVGHTQAVSPVGHQNMRIVDQSICTTIIGNCTRVTRVTCERQR
jgi:hypothetical protein